MNLKFIFKLLSLSLVTSFVFASETNNCNEIKEYLENKSLNYTKTIEKCNINDQGKVIELKINNEDLQEEDVNKILSYDSIKNLEYVVVFNEGEEEDTPYSHVLLPHPGYSKFPSVIVNLPELEILNFNYKNFRYIKYSPDLNYISIEDGFLKLSKNLKKLTLSQVEFSNENMKELSTLTNLEELKLIYCLYDKDGFTPFENHENLSKLSIINTKGYKKLIPNHIEKIKSLKELYVEKGYCEEEKYDFNGLDNLESMYFDITGKCDLDLSKNEKLSELSIVGPNDFIFGIGISSPMSIELPNSLKKLKLSDLTFSSNNYKMIASLPNLEELTLIYFGDSENFDIKSLECHDKLSKLTINSSVSSADIVKDNLDFLNDLVNLTYLNLSENGINEIPQLENLKKLMHFEIAYNKLYKFPQELTTLENIEYIDLNSNDIYDILPESLNKLENLKYFNIENNKSFSGKVLTNKSLEKCGYSNYNDLCIPKDYELNCLINKNVSLKTCEGESNSDVSTDGNCGEGHGKCPSDQCCSKDGKCGTTEDYCLISKECQINYGNCKDECEQMYDQLRKLGENKVDSITCTANKQGKAQEIVIHIGDQTYIDQLENISDLESLTIECVSKIDNFKPILHNENITKFVIIDRCYGSNGVFPEEILSLTKLKILDLPTKGIKTLPSDIKNLKNLEYLNLFRSSLKDLPDEFGELENLKTLKISDNEFTKFPKVIANLKSLESLELDYNDIDDEIPESYNNLSELKSITLGGNKNLKGKVLQNEKLETCEYDYSWEDETKYSLCRTGKEKCLTENLVKLYPLCSDTSTIITFEKPTATITTTTTTTTTTTEKTITTTTTTTEKTITTITTTTEKITTDEKTTTTTTKTDEKTTTTTTTTTKTPEPSVKGKCGEGYGKCPSGQCCSKYGWCGKTDDYCAQGCKSEFGDCKNSTTTTTITNTSESSIKDKCGPGIGSCSAGYCCSKYGWCGKSYKHCAVSEGCQSAYGLCTENNTSIEGKCGEGYGKCPSDQCCSRYGWCGKSDDYCSTSRGCQSKFGKCN